MSNRVKKKSNDLVNGESVHVESDVASSNIKQHVSVTLLVNGDHAISNKKNLEITKSVSSEDVIDVEVKEIEAPVFGLERTECLGLPEQKKVVVSLT